MRCEQPGPVLLAAAACCCWPLVGAASPFEVPDIDPDENLELKTTFERRGSGDEREWDVPQFELTFPVVPDVELSFEAGYAIEDFGATSERGWSDIEVGSKWRFLHTERSKLTLQPEVTFDTADDLGEDDHSVALALLGARTFGILELNGRVGYERSFDGDEDALFGSALLLCSLSDDLRFGAELAADDEDDALHLRINLGVKWEVSDRIELQALIGRTVENEDDAPPQTRVKLVMEYSFGNE